MHNSVDLTWNKCASFCKKHLTEHWHAHPTFLTHSEWVQQEDASNIFHQQECPQTIFAQALTPVGFSLCRQLPAPHSLAGRIERRNLLPGRDPRFRYGSTLFRW